ncbi:MAG: carboxypeptidase-like regulatory domain-containing protein [Dehalococcoidia bacterium]
MPNTKEEEKKKAIPIIIGFLGGVAALLLWRRKVTAQPDKAILYGQVTDAETGNSIQNIHVNCDGYTGKTDVNGNYRIINIPAGTYTVTFTDPSGRYEPMIV